MTVPACLIAPLFSTYTGEFPVIEATNTSSTDSSSPSHTLLLPASIAAGELLIAAISTSTGPTVTWGGTGFTEFFDVVNGSDAGLALAYKWATGSEGASITVTTGSSQKTAHLSYRISGAKNPSTQAPEASSGATGDSVNPDPDLLTPTGGTKKYLYIALYGASGVNSTTAIPTNYTGSVYKSSASGAAATIGAAHRFYEASNDNPSTYTIGTTDPWVAATIAIHPA